MLSNQLKGIYAVTDDVLTPLCSIEKNLEEALNAGVKIIQFRDKIAVATPVSIQEIYVP